MSDLPLRLTLLYPLLFPLGTPGLRAATLLLAVAGTLHPRVRGSPWSWALLTALVGWRVVAAWPLADNHAYLLCYWCLAIALARRAGDPEASLACSARLLVPLVFVFALAWKLLLSDDFLDGTFYRVLLIGDRRFEDLVLVLGAADRAALEASREFLTLGRLGGAALAEPARLRALASLLTWATLAVEALVALLWIAPLPSGAQGLRHAALLAFCVLTYAVAPVAGFGWLLLAMGLAQCPAGARRLEAAYLGGFALLLLHDVLLWPTWLRELGWA